jgi:hypothetical protein
LWLQKFDGDVVESGAGVGTGDVGEVAGGVAKLAVGHHDAGFGPVLDSVHNVGRAKRNVKIRNIVLMEKRRVVGGEAYAEYADVLIFKDQMMMRFL